MHKNSTNPRVDFFFNKPGRWKEELEAMRTIPLSSGLKEELKWGVPCYTSGGKNIVLIHAFKEYCAFLFFKGALLKDPSGILVQQTKNVQAARQVRFTSVKEITRQGSILKAYIKEAVKIEKAGLNVNFKRTAAFEIPAELQEKLKKMPALKKAFFALTPGRQRGYLLHFAAPKQSKTRESRIKKCTPQILKGKGLHD